MFAKSPKVFRSKSKNDYKILNFRKKYLSSKCSSGHVECSFENPVEPLAGSPKVFIFFIDKRWKCSSGPIKTSFENTLFLNKFVLIVLKGGFPAPNSAYVSLDNFSHFIRVSFLTHRRQKKSFCCCTSFSRIALNRD